MTITIELPEYVAEQAAAAGLDLAEVNRIATAATVGAVSAFAYQAEQEDESDPEVIAALQEAAADLDAGNLLTLEQVDAEFEAAIAARRKAREAAADSTNSGLGTAPARRQAA